MQLETQWMKNNFGWLLHGSIKHLKPKFQYFLISLMENRIYCKDLSFSQRRWNMDVVFWKSFISTGLISTHTLQEKINIHLRDSLEENSNV